MQVHAGALVEAGSAAAIQAVAGEKISSDALNKRLCSPKHTVNVKRGAVEPTPCSSACTLRCGSRFLETTSACAGPVFNGLHSLLTSWLVHEGLQALVRRE
jgi:hypothetical protein